MRLYTALIGSQRVLTLNAGDVQEAREALSTLLGDVAAFSFPDATLDEGRGVLRATGRRQGN